MTVSKSKRPLLRKFHQAWLKTQPLSWHMRHPLISAPHFFSSNVFARASIILWKDCGRQIEAKLGYGCVVGAWARGFLEGEVWIKNALVLDNSLAHEHQIWAPAA